MKDPFLKEYIVVIDSSLDIFTGNATSFTTLLPARYKNVYGAELVDITVPAIANVRYEYLAIDQFNQISSPSDGVNFAFMKIILEQPREGFVTATNNGYSFAHVHLQNPIATLDRLNVSFLDRRGNLLQQPDTCVFQLKLITGELTPNGGGSTITSRGRVLGGTF